MIELLLATPSVNVNAEFRVDTSHNALTFAAATASREIVQLLLANTRVDVNKAANYVCGSSILMMTVCSHCFLQESVTPLMHAMLAARSIEFVETLLQHPRMEINKRDSVSKIQFILFAN